ncbi:hypothetical protein THASP1DRAFT_23997 [Thamnocephalis sphaerospora]|uniref:IMS import disulfide relay-system CHCH-CHCH-like Cx9C domain-containing protein n=1 Tax=Thamnocephalis sphaerospora TaxID=78915 RepID=A0A4P9XPI9_9FUNG|nr:hypothetical protein THASP1DRAFT_23997 [Thamnocephalis sphaerospora]|eukprot:RKP07924.1 hypothetical protein THASP1DRAFT_23997 [Thamnocephalis sphaerospora]
MDATLTEVVKHCSEQLAAYSECVERNPLDWNEKCEKQRKGLTLCAENNVASLRRVKEACAEAIAAYDTCVSQNTTDPEQCMDALRALHTCTERAAGRRPGNASTPDATTPATTTPSAP